MFNFSFLFYRRRLERAAMLVEGLAGERVRWEETIKQLEEKLGYVVGDCLLASASVSYIGPFISDYRYFAVFLLYVICINNEVVIIKSFNYIEMP